MLQDTLIDFTLGGLELPAGRARDLVLEAVAVVESSNQYDQALGLLNQAGEHAAGLGAAAFVLHDLHAACLLRTRSYERALAEAELCTQLQESWPRGWARVGAALLALGQYEAALAAYNDALGWSSGSPSEEVVRGRELAQRAVEDYGCAKYH